MDSVSIWRRPWRERATASIPGSGFLDTMRQDPVLSRLKLIAEPWDLGPEGYRLGGFPPGWAEWNDRYRDVVRRWWKGDDGLIGEFASRLTGSSDLFDRAGRRPWASINYVTAHDGFTLRDLVSYDHKHNEDNLEDNSRRRRRQQLLVTTASRDPRTTPTSSP